MDIVTSRTALLRALIEGEGYGVELIERVERLTEGAVKVSKANLYVALRLMEDEGLATSREGEPDVARGGRPRRYYKLTAKGRDACHEAQRTMQLLAEGLS